MDKILVSTVTPVYRGETTLEELARRLDGVRREWERGGLPLELVESIFVDDGSVDGSGALLAELAARHPWMHLVTLSRNFGQHPATVAGILHSSGDWVATLDEDLQHEPRLVLTAVRRAAEQGWDIVYGKPLAAEQPSRFRDWSSKLYKALVAVATGNPQVRSFHSFRVVRGSVARAAASVSSHDTYFDIVLGWFSRRVGTLPLAASGPPERRRRASGYSLLKLLSHARKMLVSSQTKWLRLGAVVGVGALVFSVVLALAILAQRLIDPGSIAVRGWLSLFLAIVFFGGLSSFLLGVMLEYLSPLLLQSQGKPAFFVVDRTKDATLREFFRRQESHAAAPRHEAAADRG